MPPQTDARQTVTGLDDTRLAAAIALTRFGLGAGSGEIDAVAHDPQAWLDAQIRPSGAPNPQGDFETSAQRVDSFIAYRRQAQGARQFRRAAMPSPDAPASDNMEAADGPGQAAFDARREGRRDLTQDTAQEFLARTQHAVATDAGFAERWALFWANAFTVSATKFQSAVFMGQYEREAIRPHVFGRFEDLAVAAESHPAMLLYLDQAQSIGPDSRAGERRQAGLNENLAREIMELHTLGADAGYSQADVTEFARALTGWTLPNGRGERQIARAGNRRRPAPAADQPGRNGFVFRANVHEPGARTVLGRSYPAGGAEQGESILRDLANRPETSRRLARNLARHFVADDPPPALIDRLDAAWTRSRGDLAEVARALITAPEAWVPQPAKIKTPYDFLVSAHRALGAPPRRVQAVQPPLVQMGQPAWRAPSPEGWPDDAADWAGPDALVKRLNWAKTLGDRAAPALEPVSVADAALGPRLGERSRQAVARAESRAEAFTLLFMSPEFQRR